jgi:predicted SnoaL-like aldol condensation-catalyzing enzyme
VFNLRANIDEISKEVVMRHLNSFLDNNLEALLSDYTNESVLITQAATYSSLEEISAFFVDLNMHFPQQKSDLVLDKVVVNNDLVYITWHAKTPSLQVPIGSDTFIIKDGKIYQQTFVGQLSVISQ